MKINVKPRRKNSPRIAEKSAPGFLQWLRGRECFTDDGWCDGKIEAAHVDHAGGKGVATKVADRHAIPLCALHHREQHRMGWRSFEHRFMFDAVRIAEQYWSRWPGRIAWERKLEQ